MDFLLLGRGDDQVTQLNQALKRENIHIEQTHRPEYVFFKILHKEITGLFVDLTDPEINAEEVIAGCESTGEAVEVVLITEPERLASFPADKLRYCFGYVTPDIAAAHNSMVLNQMTEKIVAKERLERLKNSSIVDGLTQLHNHAFFQQQLDEEILLRKSMKEKLSLVILDIDHFKHYNDANGHPAGDRVLKKIARILENGVRKFDFTARYGGEEFVIVLPGVNLKTALMVTERFRKKVAETIFEYGHRQPLGCVSASFGVATLDQQGIKDKEALIHHADQALYKAKKHARNCIWYYHRGDYHPFHASLL